VFYYTLAAEELEAAARECRWDADTYGDSCGRFSRAAVAHQNCAQSCREKAKKLSAELEKFKNEFPILPSNLTGRRISLCLCRRQKPAVFYFT